MKYSKLLFSLCLFFLFQVSSYSVEGAELISVIVADTLDPSIGDSTAQDLDKVRRQLQRIALYTDLTVKEVIIQGRKTLPLVMLNKLDELEVNEDDVVVFYFSGHGYRTSDKEGDLWPYLYFSQLDEGVDSNQVVEILESKRPRLLLVMTDVCNSLVPDDQAPLLVGRGMELLEQERIEANYRHLFLETSGFIRVTSSWAGEVSWGTANGGLFTNAFLYCLTRFVREFDYPTWEEILTVASEGVSDMQHPCWVVQKSGLFEGE